MVVVDESDCKGQIFDIVGHNFENHMSLLGVKWHNSGSSGWCGRWKWLQRANFWHRRAQFREPYVTFRRQMARLWESRMVALFHAKWQSASIFSAK